MNIAQVFIRNFRNFVSVDATLSKTLTCITGENNAGKSNFLYALRLVLDSKLPSTARSLDAADFHSASDLTQPTQVVIAVELSDISGSVQRAFADLSPLPGLGSTIAYRFRPGQLAREQMDPASEVYAGDPLGINDYEWELVFCHEADPRYVKWHQALGRSLRFVQLQEFAVEYLPALRDVEHDLRQVRVSPLEKLINITSIPRAEQLSIEQAFLTANATLRKIPSINNISSSVQTEFTRIAGDVTEQEIDIAVADPSFAKLTRTLSMLFRGSGIGEIDLSRNGLGANNLLYISMISDYFRKRIEIAKAPGQLVLVDEPEAHLHPQAQRILYASLEQGGFQTVLATHSTHIASQAPLRTRVSLVRKNGATSAACLGDILSRNDEDDIDRFLDTTRATLLFARRLILVEGIAELYILPPLIKGVLGLDLDRQFISIVAIHGNHFAPYAALFTKGGLNMRCAILTDGDLKEMPTDEELSVDAAAESVHESEELKVFRNRRTFECSLARAGLLDALISTFKELRHPRLVKRFENAMEDLEAFESEGEFGTYANSILAVAKLHGKGRFAQVFSKHLINAKAIPQYIADAIAWLTESSKNDSR